MEQAERTGQIAVSKEISQKHLIILAGTAGMLLFANSLLKYFIYMNVLRPVLYVLMGITAAAGIILYAREGRHVKFHLDMILLLAFLAWYLIVCIYLTITERWDVTYYNHEPLLDTVACLLLLYPLGIMLGRDREIPGILRVMVKVLILVWTVWMAVILFHVFRGQYIIAPNGGYLGMHSGSLVMNCNRNTVGIWEVVFFPGCLYLVFRSKKAGWKVVWAICAVIHYFVLVLCASRTAVYADTMMTMAMVGFAVYTGLKDKKKAARILLAVGIGLAAGAAFYLMRRLVFGLYNATVTSFNEPGEISITVDARDMAPDARLSGRDEVWAASVRAITKNAQNMIFGVSPVMIVNAVNEAGGGEMYTHNEILEITLGLGFVGIGIFMAWLVLMLKDMWKMARSLKGQLLLLCIPVIALGQLAANMMESTLLFYQYINAYVFFLLCGYVHGYAGTPEHAKHA